MNWEDEILKEQMLAEVTYNPVSASFRGATISILTYLTDTTRLMRDAGEYKQETFDVSIPLQSTPVAVSEIIEITNKYNVTQRYVIRSVQDILGGHNARVEKIA